MDVVATYYVSLQTNRDFMFKFHPSANVDKAVLVQRVKVNQVNGTNTIFIRFIFTYSTLIIK